MLNLCKVELKKMMRSAGFWIVLGIFLVSILATFISLSYSPEAMEEMLFDYINEADAEQIGDLMRQISLEENYFKGFYSTTNGYFAVVCIGISIAMLADFRRGTAQNAVLCGFSRPQIFTAKFLCGMVGGLIFMTSLAACNLVVGPVFYNTPLNGETLFYLTRILLSQLLVLIQFVAGATAICLLMKNIWAILVTGLAFIVPACIPLFIYLSTGSETASLWFGSMPSFMSITVTQPFYSLEQRIARPDIWTPGTLLLSLGIGVSVTAFFFIIGIWGFGCKDMD